MSDYEIHIEGHDTGLVKEAVFAQIRDAFPHADSVTVIEKDSDE
jgi:hypothetical protein